MTPNQEKELFEVLNRIADSLHTIAEEISNPVGIGSTLCEISDHLGEIKDKLQGSRE